MATDPDVLAALQAAHNLEATASEKWHKQEHAFKDGQSRYPKLGRWFDRRHKEAYQRQHDIRKRIMRLGGTVETELGDTSYTDDVEDAFTAACDLLDELTEAWRAVRDAAKAAGDVETKEWLHGTMKDIQDVYKAGEAKQQQLKDLGLPLFLHKHSKTH
jgi:bacterioferritin (cytochrome b1)